jgi:hypothetical protein
MMAKYVKILLILWPKNVYDVNTLQLANVGKTIQMCKNLWKTGEQ